MRRAACDARDGAHAAHGAQDQHGGHVPTQRRCVCVWLQRTLQGHAAWTDISAQRHRTPLRASAPSGQHSWPAQRVFWRAFLVLSCAVPGVVIRFAPALSPLCASRHDHHLVRPLVQHGRGRELPGKRWRHGSVGSSASGGSVSEDGRATPSRVVDGLVRVRRRRPRGAVRKRFWWRRRRRRRGDMARAPPKRVASARAVTA